MQHSDVILILQCHNGSTFGRRAAVLFHLSHGLVQVCQINRIHHWCSVGTEKSQPKGPSFQWETRLAECPTERWTRGLGFFLDQLNTSDLFFFSYTNSTFSDHTVRYSLICVDDATEVNDARCTNQLETANTKRIQQ